ncbi:MAG: Holliday junction branch migration protein RuvA [Bacteroidota bacterium]
MIASLTGLLKAKNPTEILLDVNGVGYALSIPLSTFEKLGNVNTPTFIYTYLHVREDTMQLFGFATEQERSLFKLLISVSGIGPKIAQGILSGISASQLNEHISSGNVSALTSIPNVGKKTAERLIVELRDKVGKITLGTNTAPESRSDAVRGEALLALTSLGYQRSSAEKAIQMALSETPGSELSVEELIKRALRHTSRK